ncbi:MAG: ATP-grasp domain-containing protein [Candidatus Dormibacteria bacterium]
MPRRVLLILPTRTYRAGALLAACRELGVEAVVASDRPSTLAGVQPGLELVVDLERPAAAAEAAEEMARSWPLAAVVPADDGAVLAGAAIAERLGLRGSPVAAVAATRDKLELRRRLEGAGLPQPRHWAWSSGVEPPTVSFPAVVKPLDQAGSRGVIRVEDQKALSAAGDRVRRLLARDGCGGEEGIPLVVEEFLAGPEVALEGVLVQGRLHRLAVYDKPEPLDGPYFEETIYTVPSALDPSRLAQVQEEVQQATWALGLLEGAVHAELRLGQPRPHLIDMAARSIGGRCSGVLRFRSGRTLEQVLVAAALGDELGELELEPGVRGVMMLPIPHAGTLGPVPGRDGVLLLPGIDGVELTVPPGGRVLPLPEGDRYLGFIFAHGPDPAAVARLLRRAQRQLGVVIRA